MRAARNIEAESPPKTAPAGGLAFGSGLAFGTAVPLVFLGPLGPLERR